MTLSIYLANPYGFSKQQKELLAPIKKNLSLYGLEVLEPFEENPPEVALTGDNWAYTVAHNNLRDIERSDAIFAVVNGTPPDEGVMIELGYAMARGKNIFLFRDDFRRCSDSDVYPLNLMIFAGLPRSRWESFYYTSVSDIRNLEKGLTHVYGPPSESRIVGPR